MNLGPYGKTITAIVAGLIGWATQVSNSEVTKITSAEWIALATVLAIAFGVFGVKNAA